MVKVAGYFEDFEVNRKFISQLEGRDQACKTQVIDIDRLEDYRPEDIAQYPGILLEITDPNHYPLNVLNRISQDYPDKPVVVLDRIFYKKLDKQGQPYGEDKIKQGCVAAGANKYFAIGSDNIDDLVEVIKGWFPDQIVVPWIGLQGGGFATGFERHFYRRRYRLSGIRDVATAGSKIETIGYPLIITDLEPPGELPNAKQAWQKSRGIILKARLIGPNKKTPIVVIGNYNPDHKLRDDMTVTEILDDCPDVHYFHRAEGSKDFVEFLKRFL